MIPTYQRACTIARRCFCSDTARLLKPRPKASKGEGKGGGKWKMSEQLFYTAKPIILGESAGKKVIQSMQIVGLGLFLYSNYALVLYWNPNRTDMMLTSIFAINMISLLIVRQFGFSNLSRVTLLPKYRLRFDKYSWFAREKASNSVEYDFQQIGNVTKHKYGYAFITPESKFNFPLFLWIDKRPNKLYSTENGLQTLDGLVKFYQRQGHKLTAKRLNSERN